ncbi:phage tail tape measure protein [Leeia aquatica]|uniref:Phage tail tape measure protein n=1 Tax=Leeia aquatica TaxID=2725557 RepID=A0A847S7H2_9NEIS|nr:phage tail tape measure protein [Leeia aquatica]NLR73586.1 phage tail tape measure protein [Leeia aquatica]
MANELLVGVKIGAALGGSFQTAFSSARGTLVKLGQVTDELRHKHDRLRDAMTRAMSHPARNVTELRRQYDRLGHTLDQLRTKQQRLANSLARGDALKASRADLRGQAMETAGVAVAVGAPVLKSVRMAGDFQDQMRDVAITGGFSRAEEARVGQVVRDAALQWNQTQSEIGRGLGVLVAGGIQDARALERYAPIMAKASTATRASMDDLGALAIALKDNLKIGEAGFEGALNMLTWAGKQGQFEIRDMAKWLPSLTPMMADLGVTGKEAVAELAASLQIARKGAGSNDEAANNFKNFLQKLTSPDTLKDFERAGIDLKQSMLNLRAQGMTPLQSMLAIITQYMQSKGPDAARQFQQIMAIKDDQERKAALQRLSEAYKLGDLFQDMQAMGFIRPALANQGEMKALKQGAMKADSSDVMGKDWQNRMDTFNEQFKAFKIQLMDIGLTIGQALLPPLVSFLKDLKPTVKAFGEWAKTHPGVIKGVIGLVAGLLASKVAFLTLRYGINLVKSPITDLITTFESLSARWSMLKALWQSGKFAPIVNTLRTLGSGVMTFFRVVWGVVGTVMRFVPVALRFAGTAILWLGRLLLANPIGLVITVIAGAVYLIYRNWGPIKSWFQRLWAGTKHVFSQAWAGIKHLLLNYTPAGLVIKYWAPITAWFKGLWNGIKSAFSGGIGGVCKLILDWSPLGLFYKAFAGVMKWFGVDMPKSFTEFGANVIDGLVKGIKAKFGAAKDAIISFGKDIKGWFTSTLGIKSPSRVFMGFGDNIAEGTAIGIGRSAPLASRAATSMATKTAAAARRIKAAQGEPLAPGMTGGTAGLTIHFNPTIQLQAGASSSTKTQVTEALRLSLHELEQLIKRVLEQQARRNYTGA